MNQEEKKAIEDMNRFANGIDMSCVTARQMQIVLNLIEKLQKENFDLKNSLSWRINYCQELERDLFENCSNYVIPIQKVKDKIKELNRKINNGGKTYGGYGGCVINSENIIKLQNQIEALKELLEGKK